MSYYPLMLEVARKASEVFSGYCEDLSVADCSARILKDFSSSFSSFNIYFGPFFDYPLFNLGNKTTNVADGKCVFEGEARLEMPAMSMTNKINPKSYELPIANLSEAFGCSINDGRFWLYSINTGRFFLPVQEGRSGFYSLSPSYNTLGNFNYGYKIVGNEFVFKNFLENVVDDDCEGTQYSKADSLYAGKFNCVFGQKYTNDTIDEIEIFSMRNPGFKDEDVFFIEPRIPYLTTRSDDIPLNLKSGKFYNPPLKRYGIPLIVEEQTINNSYTILSHLINYSTFKTNKK